tara:strand:+ start:40 stop:1194 length:1155 start_codon:yes stop_codon:yes gene_type:complete
MAFKMKGSAFKLKSGNTSSFKMMGSSPARQVDPDAPGTKGTEGYEPPVTREDLDDEGKAIWDKLRGIGADETIPSDTPNTPKKKHRGTHVNRKTGQIVYSDTGEPVVKKDAKTPPMKHAGLYGLNSHDHPHGNPRTESPAKQTHEDTKKKAAKNDWDAGSTLEEGDYASYDQQAYDVNGDKIDFNAHEFTGPVIKNQNGRPYSEEEGNDKVIFWSGKSSSGTPASPAKHPIEDVVLSGDGSKVTHRHDKKGKSHWVGKNGKDISKDVLKSLAGGGVNKKPFKQRSPNKHVVPNDAQGRNHTNPHEKTKGGGNVSYVTYDDKKKKKEVKSTNDDMVRSRRKAPKKKKDTFYRDSNNDGSVVSRAIKKIKMPKIVMGGNGPYGNLK